MSLRQADQCFSEVESSVNEFESVERGVGVRKGFAKVLNFELTALMNASWASEIYACCFYRPVYLLLPSTVPCKTAVELFAVLTIFYNQLVRNPRSGFGSSPSCADIRNF
jgi:hypothetical protein